MKLLNSMIIHAARFRLMVKYFKLNMLKKLSRTAGMCKFLSFNYRYLIAHFVFIALQSALNAKMGL